MREDLTPVSSSSGARLRSSRGGERRRHAAVTLVRCRAPVAPRLPPGPAPRVSVEPAHADPRRTSSACLRSRRSSSRRGHDDRARDPARPADRRRAQRRRRPSSAGSSSASDPRDGPAVRGRRAADLRRLPRAERPVAKRGADRASSTASSFLPQPARSSRTGSTTTRSSSRAGPSLTEPDRGERRRRPRAGSSTSRVPLRSAGDTERRLRRRDLPRPGAGGLRRGRARAPVRSGSACC